jgi:hypothetical protein
MRNIVDFDSNYKLIKKFKKKKFYLIKNYGYAPIILIHVACNEKDIPIPYFSISQLYIDELSCIHYLTDSFILYSESFNKKYFKYYYHVFDYNNKLLEEGELI